LDYRTIRLDLHDAVAVVTLNRPEVMNALNARMRAELIHVLRALGQSASGARTVVLTGAGRAFCSGQDLGDAQAGAGLDLEATLRDEYEPMLAALGALRQPVIAAVNGVAAGAGANLALAADVVIASEAASFVQAFTRIGLMPDAGGTWRLPRQVGMARAMGMALFADKIGARQAADWGLIWEAVPETSFDAHWRDRATALAQGPTVAYAAVKQAMAAAATNTLDAQLALEAVLQGHCGRTRDFAEGVRAFAEKRPPQFEGR
jgi:2-(1,2-epoxy-1,2-dihydrophenyl)acetyl-CoA isomerase